MVWNTAAANAHHFSPPDSLSGKREEKVLGKGSNHNMRFERPFGLSANFGTPALVGVSADYFLLEQLNLEAGIGPGQYVGVKYHFLGGFDWATWSPFVGASFFHATLAGDSAIGAYLPVGVHYIGPNGFSFSIEASFAFAHSTDDDSQGAIPFGGIRLGYRFY